MTAPYDEAGDQMDQTPAVRAIPTEAQRLAAAKRRAVAAAARPQKTGSVKARAVWSAAHKRAEADAATTAADAQARAAQAAAVRARVLEARRAAAEARAAARADEVQRLTVVKRAESAAARRRALARAQRLKARQRSGLQVADVDELVAAASVASVAHPESVTPAAVPTAASEHSPAFDADADPTSSELRPAITRDAAASADRSAPVSTVEPPAGPAAQVRRYPRIQPNEDPEVPDALQVRDLVKRFGRQQVLRGIDLTVPAGSFYGIVGPNGAGKTTTLSIISGLLRADAGTVHICGVDAIADPRAAKRMMGVLPDQLRTFDRLTGRQLLQYYGLLRGLDAQVIATRVADLARAFDLHDALGRVVSDYSAGMTKKLMLAGAMIHSPRLLVLDEPFEAVDPVASEIILDILHTYVSHGGTVILSSHGMDLVERVCSGVAVIVGGDVLAQGPVDEVRAGRSLEARFVELAGGVSEAEGLEWLHTFSS